MNVTDLKAEFGAYYQAGSQNVKDLVKQIYFKSETDALFTTVDTDDTVIRRSSAQMGRLLQPFQKKWSPTGTLTFSPVEIKLYPMKFDFEDYPDELVESWAGFLTDNNLNRKEWPFIKWLISEHILEGTEQDYELNEVFEGVYAAPGTPGTAGAAGTAMDGIRKILNDHITAGRITPIATGALSTDPVTFVGQIEAFCAVVDERYRFEKMNLVMNKTLAARFKTGNRLKYNMSYSQVDDLITVVDYNKTVVGVSSHKTSAKIWMTPKINAICGRKGKKNEKAVNIEGLDRLVKIYSDWFKGVGFIIPELVFTNDQDLI
jgi:hypothetical protein